MTMSTFCSLLVNIFDIFYDSDDYWLLSFFLDCTNEALSRQALSRNVGQVPTIFAITYTRKRLTQLLDLTSLCQTLMNVEELLWIVVESTLMKTALVSDVLDSCKIKSVHLLSSIYSVLTNTTDTFQSRSYSLRRGTKERNVGLEWLRRQCQQPGNCSGSVYFLDDDSKYDLRLFKQVVCDFTRLILSGIKFHVLYE